MLRLQEHGGAGNDNTSECLILFAFSQGTRIGFVEEHVLKRFDIYNDQRYTEPLAEMFL